MSTGMTLNEVLDQFDLPTLRAFNDYWKGFPPVHVMVAAYFGIEPEKRAVKAADGAMDPAVLAELMAQFPVTP